MDKTNRSAKNTPLTAASALARMEHYCAYQDRCHSEVRAKLREFTALRAEERENIICSLIENRFLDEERFTRSFVRGKHRFKHWGRLRITRELRARDIPDRLIRQAIDAEIDPQEYRSTFRRLFSEKQKAVGGLSTRAQIAKIYNYMVSHGYEPDLIWDAIQSDNQQNTDQP